MNRSLIALALATLGAAAMAQSAAPAARPAPAASKAASAAVPVPAGWKDVTRAEAIKRATEQFDRMDLNHDGVVTFAEMSEAQRQMREKFEAQRAASTGAAGAAGAVAGAGAIAAMKPGSAPLKPNQPLSGK